MRKRVNFLEKTGLSLLQALMVMGWLVIILNGAQVALAQWIGRGPLGGPIQALAIDPQTPATLYAGTYGGGVFKSSNGGGSWSAVNTGLTNTNVHALAIDPQTPATLYAGTDRGGVFKSSNGGGSWSAVNTGLTRTTVYALTIDPQTLYAGTDGGVFKSGNGGGSWSAINSGLTNINIRALAIDPQTPATLYTGTYGGGVFKSSNGGGSWSAINTGLTNTEIFALAIDSQTPATLYAGTGGGVFKSSNDGGSWSAINSGLTNTQVFAFAIDPQTPATLYAGTYGGGVFKSSNGGGSWGAANTGLIATVIYALAIDPQTPATLYAGTLGGGVFKSSNGGESWNPANTGLTNTVVNALAIDPQTPATLYAGTQGGVFKSSNGGAGWNEANTGLTRTNVYALVLDPQTSATLYAGTFGGGVFKSGNGGGSWSPVTNGLTDNYVYALTIDPQRPATLYVGTGGGVYKSSNAGESWSAASIGLPNTDVYVLAIDPQTPATLYAGTFSGVFKSTNGGGSWSPANSGLSNTYVYALAIDPQRPATLYAGTYGGGVFKSSDGSGSWSAINTGLTNALVYTLAIDPQDPSRIYAGTWGGGVFVTSVADCSNSISPLNQSCSSSGLTRDQVTVTATGCGWTAVSQDSWITITSGSSGSANGTVTFSVAANTSAVSRAGTLTIAGKTFTVTQAGVTSDFSLISISPNSGPITGGTSVTLHGGGFQVGASVSLSGVRATVNTVTSTEITATTGIATEPGTYDVVITNPGGQSMALSKGFTYMAATGLQMTEVFVPIVLSSSGASGSFYSSEMTLTHRGVGNATVNFNYTASLGSGSGTGMDTLGPGEQKIVPDAISYLRGLGVPISSSGNQGGTLRVSFSGLTSPADGSVTVRTTTVVPEGRAGLAYAGIPTSTALTDPSYICGLRQNETDRSNVAVQHVGTAEDGNIRLQLTVFSGASGPVISKVLPEQVLAPGGFVQISGILTSNGLSLSNGYVRVERVSGSAPYYAYGVINDQSNSDGSFIPPVLESALAGKTRMTLPVVVESGPFTTELVVTNGSTTKKTLGCRFVSDNVSRPDATASFTMEVNPFQQLIWPELVQKLRDAQITGIGAKGLTYAGALPISVATGDLSGISVAARTSASGGGGRYGLYYTAMAEGTTTTNTAWLYGLQQNSENRTNLALINTGETDSSVDTFRIELFNGETGAKVATVEGISLGAYRWHQIGMILSQYAPGVTQGYARITRTGGNNPFIAYAVINDGATSGDRSGDGTFVASAP